MIQRYLRAFWVAWRMTLRGERPQAKYPTLAVWMQGAVKAIDGVIESAEKNHLRIEARRKFLVKIDGRSMSMETILMTVRYHLVEEYPYLLRNETEHSLTAIYSSNINDQYYVTRLGEALEQQDVKSAVQHLGEFLAQLPSDVKPQS